jgi:hypothetical protein
MSKREAIFFILMVVAVASLAVAGHLREKRKSAAREKTPAWMEPMIAERQKLLSEIHVEDGIDAAEATLIGGLYLSEFMGGCGVTEEPDLKEGQWTMKTRLGAVGNVVGSVISVDPKTGGVSKPSGPRYPTLKAFADDLADGFAARRR